MLRDRENYETFVAANTLAGSKKVSRVRGTCPCGAKIEIPYDMTECEKCGRLYNLVGQELEPPHKWEPEDRENFFNPLSDPY